MGLPGSALNAVIPLGRLFLFGDEIVFVKATKYSWFCTYSAICLYLFLCLKIRNLRSKTNPSHSMILRQAATWVRCFVKCFWRVPKLYCSFPAAGASKGNSQKIVYKTPDPTN